MPTKQWLQAEADNEIVIRLLLSFISSFDFKPLLVPIEENSGSVYLGNITTCGSVSLTIYMTKLLHSDWSRRVPF